MHLQVHFMKASDGNKQQGDTSIIHTMNRRSRMTGCSHSLVEQRDSLTELGQGEITEKSSYVSSTVSLYGGDHVCVMVNNISMVHPNGAATYFGLYLM